MERVQNPKLSDEPKYQNLISAEAIGNQLIISLAKDSKKRSKKWDPPCDCDIPEIIRPTKREGVKIHNNGNNDIVFRTPSSTQAKMNDYIPQTISYKVGDCESGLGTNDQCRQIIIKPQEGGTGYQKVQSDFITKGNQQIYTLRVKRKSEFQEQEIRNLELELHTPNSPTMIEIPKIDPSTFKENPLLKSTEPFMKIQFQEEGNVSKQVIKLTPQVLSDESIQKSKKKQLKKKVDYVAE